MAEGEPEKMYSVGEAAQHIGVSRDVIKAALRRNSLTATKEHGIRLIKASDLEAYKHRTQPEGRPRRGRPKKQRPAQDEGQTPQ